MRKKLWLLLGEINLIRKLNIDLGNQIEQVQENIEAILAEPGPIDENRLQHIVQKLKKIIEDFEGSHPGVTSKLGKIVDFLSRMGF